MILIFPVRSIPHPDRPGKVKIPDAGIVQRGLSALGCKCKNDDPLYRETKESRLKSRALVLFAGSRADPIEVRLGAATIWVHPSLGFTKDQIRDNWSFGNGVTCGGISIQSGPLAGQVVPCAWIVVDDADGPAVLAKAAQIGQLFQVVV